MFNYASDMAAHRQDTPLLLSAPPSPCLQLDGWLHLCQAVSNGRGRFAKSFHGHAQGNHFCSAALLLLSKAFFQQGWQTMVIKLSEVASKQKSLQAKKR